MLKRISAAQKRWPEGMPYRIFQPKQRKGRDYGQETPVRSIKWKIAEYAKLKAKAISLSIKNQLADEANRIEALLILGVCGVIAICLMTFYAILPTAIDGLIDHQRAVVEESRR